MGNPRTTLAPGLRVDGELRGPGDVTILGRFEGTVQIRGELHVAAGAQVNADVVARTVRIDGVLHGRVRAIEAVAIGADGQLVGDVEGHLNIEPGGVFEGKTVSTSGIPRRRTHEPTRPSATMPVVAPGSAEPESAEATAVSEVLDAWSEELEPITDSQPMLRRPRRRVPLAPSKSAVSKGRLAFVGLRPDNTGEVPSEPHSEPATQQPPNRGVPRHETGPASAKRAAPPARDPTPADGSPPGGVAPSGRGPTARESSPPAERSTEFAAMEITRRDPASAPPKPPEMPAPTSELDRSGIDLPPRYPTFPGGELEDYAPTGPPRSDRPPLRLRRPRVVTNPSALRTLDRIRPSTHPSAPREDPEDE